MVEGFDQAAAIAASWFESACRSQHFGEIGTAEIGHAQDAQAGALIVANRVHRDNVSVLKLSEDLRLISLRLRYLDRHQPVTKIHLRG